MVELCYLRARMAPGHEAIDLLREARQWVERLQFNDPRDIERRARQFMREAEATPSRESELLAEAEARFREILSKAADQAAAILTNWASSLGELAMARSGDRAAELLASMPTEPTRSNLLRAVTISPALPRSTKTAHKRLAG